MVHSVTSAAKAPRAARIGAARIVIAAAAGTVSQALLNQLGDGGRLVAPLGNDVSQRLILLKKQGQTVSETMLCYCRFVKLISEDPASYQASED